jgi:hypothetical protein
MKYDTVLPRGKEDSSVQFFIYLHAYSAAQRPIIKQKLVQKKMIKTDTNKDKTRQLISFRRQ